MLNRRKSIENTITIIDSGNHKSIYNTFKITLGHVLPDSGHISASEKKGSVDSASAVSITACTTACTTTGTEDPGTILLQVVPLRVMGADGLVVTTYAMLDSGSEITLVDPSLVSSLRLSGRPDRLVLSTVNSQGPQEGERVALVVESLIDEQPQRLQQKGVWSGKELNIPLCHQGITRDKAKWPHLQDVPFPEVAQQKVSLIIGTKLSRGVYPLGSSVRKPKRPYHNPFMPWLRRSR